MNVSDATIFKIGQEIGLKIGSGNPKIAKKAEMQKRIEWVLSKKGEVTIEAIADKFSIAYNSAKGMCIRHELPYKHLPVRHTRVIEFPAHLFNIHQYKNWLVGFNA